MLTLRAECAKAHVLLSSHARDVFSSPLRSEASTAQATPAHAIQPAPAATVATTDTTSTGARRSSAVEEASRKVDASVENAASIADVGSAQLVVASTASDDASVAVDGVNAVAPSSTTTSAPVDSATAAAATATATADAEVASRASELQVNGGDMNGHSGTVPNDAVDGVVCAASASVPMDDLTVDGDVLDTSATDTTAPDANTTDTPTTTPTRKRKSKKGKKSS